MTLTRSLPTQHTSGLPLIDERRITAGMVVRNTDGTARPGIIPVHTNALVTGRASMGYDIAAFNAVSARTSAGAEQVANDGTVTYAPAGYVAPAANSRVDVIWFRCQFVVLGDANNDVVFGITQGTPAATNPTKPSIPAGAVELATATIPSTATTTQSSGVVITQTHLYTSALGGLVLVRNDTERTAFAAADGTRIRQIDTGFTFTRIAGAWVADDTGWVAITLNSGWSTYAGERGYYRVRNGICTLIGRVTGSTAAGTSIGQLPAVARPTLPLSAVWNTHSDDGLTTMLMDSAGNVVIASRIGLQRQGVSLAGITFPVG